MDGFQASLSGQHGGVSPFMFGLITGMAIFSALSMQWATRELEAQQALNAAREQAKAEDIARAMEFDILSETKETYREDYALGRALGHTAEATGRTRGGEEVLVVARDGGEGRFGNRAQEVAITASDDTLYRSKLYRTGSAEELSRMENTANHSLVTFNSADVRDRQIRTSTQNMEALAEHIYSFYASHMRFPTGSEYDELERSMNLRDVWNQRFTYNQSSDDLATLEMTTPWNYVHTLRLSLGKDADNTQSATNHEN